jgi:putative endopeptidase
MKRRYLVMLALPVLTLTFSDCMRVDKKAATPGIDLTNLDKTTPPGNDFYQYACGGWMKQHPLPGEFSRYGTFDKLGDDNQSMLRSLVENVAKNPGQEGSLSYKIGTFYSLGMDTLAIEKAGIEPVKSDLQKIEAINSKADFVKEVAYLHSIGAGSLFDFFAVPDDKNSKMNIAALYQGGLGLPDRDYYLSTDENTVKTRKEYVAHISRMLVMAGVSQDIADKKAADVLDIETRLAKISRSRVDLRDPNANYNKITVDELCNIAPVFDWKTYFSVLGVSFSNINVGQPDFFKQESQLLNEVSLDQWKSYLTWHFLNSASSYLSNAFAQEHFNFYGKTLSGRKKMQPRWKRVIGATDEALGNAVGKLYVERYFPAQSKERMLVLIENLRSAMNDRISNLSWMSDETKAKAKEKLAAIKVKVGYPDKWRDFSGMDIKKDAYVLNVFRSNKFNYQFNLSKIDKPVDPTEWDMTPQTVNAYYNPSGNEICFPAAILQPPFFNVTADDAVNYGAIGVVIGHEMTHGFDDQGRQYDKEGNLQDWWTPEDAKKFTALAEVLAGQYSNITVLDSIKANGHLTLGENIADHGGLNIAYTALQKALKQKPQAKEIDGLTTDQRFFLAYATVWAGNISNQEILRRTRTDPHSLGKWRVNAALRNITQFYKAFDIKEGSPMFLPEKDRVLIW